MFVPWRENVIGWCGLLVCFCPLWGGVGQSPEIAAPPEALGTEEHF